MLLRSLTLVFALLAFTQVNAAPIAFGTYTLHNHPDGNAADPLYGLRLDGLLDGNTSKIFTFDFDHAQSDMKMKWDGSKIEISGSAWGGRDTGNSYGGLGDEAARLWNINFSYMVDINNNPNSVVVGCNGCTDQQNSGTISSDLGTFDLFDVGNGMHNYTFKLGHNHRGHDGISGWGWMNHCNADPAGNGANCDQHLYASDWLFTAKIPEPSVLALFGLGLLGIGFSKRKARNS